MVGIKQKFIDLATSYCSEEELVEKAWERINHHYKEQHRFYHDLSHLENLLKELTGIKSHFQDYEAILFALYYHDVIYEATSRKNEEESAQFASEELLKLNVDANYIDKCSEAIMATKSHELNSDNDINLFTDADLSILGSDWETYMTYFEGIRKEYIVFPDDLYKDGRVNVLKHFLDMDKVFKTEYFYDKYEKNARNNIKRELELLESA